MENKINYEEIIMNLTTNENLLSSRLKRLKKLGKTIENTPKTIVIDIITTNSLYIGDKDDINSIINRDMEITFEEDLILDRDIAYILLDYFNDINIKYYQKQSYYKALVEMSLIE